MMTSDHRARKALQAHSVNLQTLNIALTMAVNQVSVTATFCTHAFPSLYHLNFSNLIQIPKLIINYKRADSHTFVSTQYLRGMKALYSFPCIYKHWTKSGAQNLLFEVWFCNIFLLNIPKIITGMNRFLILFERMKSAHNNHLWS